MDLMKTDYEFLDLSDVKEAELNKLQCALYERIPDISASALAGGWNEPIIDPSSCSSSTAGAPTVSSSVDSLSGGECEMAPHSPARAAQHHAPPPPYAQPPPAYPPPHHHQWPVAPPNVYVSQVTANVNVHGYMGQYYQPQPQYAAAAPGVPAGPPLEGGAGLRVLRALRPFAGSQEARQEDAEEFLGCLLNSLNDEMLELIKLVEPEEARSGTAGAEPEAAASVAEGAEDAEWQVMGPRNRGAVERRWAARRTPVADIFRGRTRLRLHRAAHHDVTDAVQPFFTLQLDIERANSVKDALELLAGKDTLEGVSDAWQQLSLEQLPVVLLLHLKCFQLDADGHTAKIVKNIDFPIDLKIDPKIMSSKLKYTSKQRVYKLFAVVYHEGVEAVKGHYLTDTFHGQVGWIRYDDSAVSAVSEAGVLKARPPRMPYLLMYRRHDTLPPLRKPD